MTTKTNRRKIDIAKLIVHPGNVRAPENYSADGLTALKASIATLGLLQTPVVQLLEGGLYGALIGGRRITALQGLKDEGVIDYSAIECIVIDPSVPHVTAMSLAENATQERMHALDEFAAFARMAEDGMSIADIARSFALTERHVRERLTYGRIHPEIRAAYRNRSLDALKAYGCNPDTVAQLAVYESLDDFGRNHAYSIKTRLEQASIQASNPRAAFVLDRYRAAGGPIIESLFPDNSVLQDSALVERLLLEGLQEIADAEKAEHGFAWAKALPASDPGLLANYTTVRSSARDLTETEEARLDQITDRIDAIEAEFESATDEEEAAALQAEADSLSAEIDVLQQPVYDPTEAAAAGVLVWWTHHGPEIRRGLVERAPIAAVTPVDGDIDGEKFDTGGEQIDEGAETLDAAAEPAEIIFSARLVDDLGLERAEMATVGLTQAGPLATQAALFAVAMIGLTARRPKGLLLTRENAWQRHSGGNLRDTPVLQAIQDATAGLAMDWLNAETPEEQFRAFCRLDDQQREALLAVALGKLLDLPLKARNAFSFGEVVAGYALASIRDVWTPDATFWGRLTRPLMLAVLRDLGLSNYAAGMTAAKKADLVGYMTKLFAGVDIGLTEAQRAAVADWTPDRMEVLALAGDAAAEPAEVIPLLEAAE